MGDSGWKVIVRRGTAGVYAAWIYEVIINAFFATLGTGSFVVVLMSAIGRPIDIGPPVPAYTLLIAGPFAAYTLRELLRSLAALLLPAWQIEGRIQEAGELTHEGSRASTHLWHVVVGGHDYSFGRGDLAEHARTGILIPGHAARLRVARDGEVLSLEVAPAGPSAAVAHQLPPAPKEAPQPLTVSERARIVRWVGRELALALVVSAGFGAVMMVVPGVGLKLLLAGVFVACSIWVVGALRLRLALGKLDIGAATFLVEGRQRSSVGALSRRSVGGVRVEDASDKPPSPLAQQVRGRAITLDTPGLATSKTTIVVEWVAEA